MTKLVNTEKNYRVIAFDWVRTHLRTIIWSLASAYCVVKITNFPIPLDYTAPVTLALMLFLLTEIYENTRKTSVIVYEKQSDADAFLSSFIDTYRPKEATFLQLSGRKVENLVERIIERGGKVTLCLQKPEAIKAISVYQYNRIIEDIHSLAATIPRQSWENLEIYLFDAPVSVKAIQIDNEILLVGVYIYEKKADETEVWGHNVLGFQVHKESSDFIKFKNLIQRVKNDNTINNQPLKLGALIEKYPRKTVPELSEKALTKSHELVQDCKTNQSNSETA